MSTTSKPSTIDSKESKESTTIPTTTMSVPISTTTASKSSATKSTLFSSKQPQQIMDDESYARSLAGEFEMNPPRNDFFHPPSVIGGGVGNGWNMNANPFIPTLNKKAARFQPYPLSDGCDPTVKKAKTLKTILKKKEEDKKLPQIPEIPPVPAAAVKDDDEEEDEDGSDDDEEEDMDEEMTTTLCLKMSKLSRRYVDIIQSQQRMIQQLTEYVVRLKAEQEEADQV